MRETIGDIDILAAAADSAPLMAAFVGLPLRRRGHRAAATKKTSVRTTDGLQVDLRVVPPDVLGRGAAVLHRLQGAQRPRSARSRCATGLKLSEYGLFEAETTS